MSRSKTRLVADFLGKIKADPTTGEVISSAEEYTDQVISELVGDTPTTLDTLEELSTNKVDKINITGDTVGSASQVPVITFNEQGQITSATETAVAGVSSTSYNATTGVITINTSDGGSHTADLGVGTEDSPTFADVTLGTSTSTVSETLDDKVDKINVTGATVGSASQVPVITYNAQGQITSATTTNVAGVSSFSYDSTTEQLTITTADGGSYSVDVSSLASESFVNGVVANLVDSAPVTLDTLNELAAALGDDPNFATTVSNSIGTKAAKTTTVSAGTALTGGGDLSANRTISHANVTRSNTTDSGTLFHSGTFEAVTSVTTNAQGHVTGAETTTYTLPAGAVPNNATITISAGTDLTTGGNFTTDQGTNETITVNHSNISRTDTTSSASPSHGGTVDVVNSVSTNARGHVTGIDVKTITLPADNNTWRPIHDSPVNGATTTSISSNWAFDNVKTAVPLGAVFTDTVYSHPTHPGDDINLDTGALTGATVISDLDFNVTTDTLGHVTDANATYSTRNLTYSDVGAAAASHSHSYLPLSGGTMTGNIMMNDEYIDFKTSGNPALPQIRGFRGTTDLNTRLLESEGGFAWTTYDSSTANKPSGTTNNANGVLSLNTHGGAYGHQLAFTNSGGFWHRSEEVGSIRSWDRVFTDSYHPNADKWTTARNNNINLTGDVTGYGSASVDGTGNWTVTVNTTVGNDSHSHSNYVLKAGDTMTGRLVFPDAGYSIGNEYHTWKRSYSINNTSPANLLYHDGTALDAGGVYRFHAHIAGTGTDQSATAVFWNQNGTWKVNVTYQSGTSSNHPEFIIGGSPEAPQIHIDHPSNYTVEVLGERLELSEGTGTDNQSGFGTDAFLGSVGGILRYNNGGTANTYDQGYKVFHDGYHPNADKWTTARTLSLTGDVTGSVSWDGSGNASLTATVADDSHTHDGRYYTESESDNRYQFSAGLHNRFYLNNGSTGVRWYKLGYHPNTSGFVQITGTIGSHVETFGTSRLDLTMFAREGSNGANVSFDGKIQVAYSGSGILAIRSDNDGGYEGYEIWLKVPSYAQCCIDVNSIGLSYDGSTYVTSAPTGFATEIDSTSLSEGHYSVQASTIYSDWNYNNDGSGSGLDADLLDGNHASAFALSSHTHSYLPLSGGTLTGALAANAGISQDGFTILNGSDTWLRTNGQTGWYSATYGGGWYMTDSTYVRTYNNKSIYTAGEVLAGGNVTAYSDRRLKTNIEVIPDALAKVSTLSGYTFDRVDMDTARQTGVIAQEVQAVLPEAVTEDENGTLAVSYGNMVGLLIEAIKELTKRVKELEGR